jgi:hypothetical protein
MGKLMSRKAQMNAEYQEQTRAQHSDGIFRRSKLFRKVKWRSRLARGVQQGRKKGNFDKRVNGQANHSHTST